MSKLGMPMIKIFKRIMDRRSLFGSLKKKVSDPNDVKQVDVNTKMFLHNDLKTLYTGLQISSHYVYA